MQAYDEDSERVLFSASAINDICQGNENLKQDQMKPLICLFILVIISGCGPDGCRTNPRKLNGKTSYPTRDSLYYISFQIDGVVYIDRRRMNKYEVYKEMDEKRRK